MKSAKRYLGETEKDGSRTERQSAFLAALGAGIVGDVPHELLNLIRNSINREGSVNYWLPGSPERRNEPYPDDLDDTAVTLGLFAHDVGAPTYAALFTKLLIQQEVTPGGPYKTWLTPNDAWDDVDPIVNANIAWCLKQFGVHLPQLQAYLTESLRKNTWSPYYCSRWLQRFLLIRGGAQCGEHELRRWLTNDAPRGVTDLAAAVLTFREMGAIPPAFLLNTLSQHAVWEPVVVEHASLCAYSGSVFFTRCLLTAARRKPEATEVRQSSRQVHLSAPPELQPRLSEMIKRIAASQTEVGNVATSFAQSINVQLAPRDARRIRDATLWGWIAYTEADACMDGDGVDYIPLVQLATRRSVQLFTDSAPAWFGEVVQRYFDRVDAANASELAARKNGARSTLPLSERSVAHTLGPLRVLALAGYTPQAKEWQSVENMYEAYLSLRQLLDDAHDWREDQEQGIVTPITELVRSDADRGFLERVVPFMKTEYRQLTRALSKGALGLPRTWRVLECELLRLEHAYTELQSAAAYVQSLHRTE